jgi:uncharacterized protein (TIGR02594 family)
MKFPKKYEWLANVGLLPRMVTEALKEYGTIETPGSRNNAKILAWAKEVGLKAIYTADSIPWCGLFMRVIAQRAGKPWGKENSLWALNWAHFGTAIGQPCLGDVLVFTRTSGGHVGLYIAEDKNYYHVLGGNQSDSVSITRVDKKRLYAARRPKAFFRMPDSVKPYIVTTGGAITTNEQ